MANQWQKELQFLTRTLRRDEAEVLAEAIQTGVHGMFVRHVRDRYLRGKLSRRQAVKLIGSRVIDESDEAWRAIEADVKWGLTGE
jgi:hypothetical protein